MKPYITVGLIWKTPTEAVPIPMLGVHATPDAARDDGFRSIAQAAVNLDPSLLACPVTVTALPLDDETLRDFLAALATHAPAALQNLAVDRVRRGRPKSDPTP